MGLESFKLIKKTKLTQDIFELIFELSYEVVMKPGQFITFILPKLGGRAYSIAEKEGNKIKLIIKKQENGRGGSIFICDLEPGVILNGIGASGHFTLKENNKNKIFLGTGTGLVPLYNQFVSAIEKKLDCNLKLIFGTRFKEDLFYIDKLNNLKNNNKNFDFEVFLSKDEVKGFNKGYITDFLTKDNIKNFEEFYICGIPQMADEAIKKLNELGINREYIMTEKY